MFLAATDGRYGFAPVLLGCSAVDLSKTGVFLWPVETEGIILRSVKRVLWG
jgi:hypothetical protein